MIKTTLRIGGMMCGMCEAHVNDAIRARFNVKKGNIVPCQGRMHNTVRRSFGRNRPARGNSRHGIRAEVR